VSVNVMSSWVPVWQALGLSAGAGIVAGVVPWLAVRCYRRKMRAS
jgi:hypothetical protein